MAKTIREERKDVWLLRCARIDISLEAGQFFCTTPKAWEIWQEEPLMRVKRIPRKQVIVVVNS